MSISWSTDPLLKTTYPADAVLSMLEDITFFRRMWATAIILAIMYPAAHRLLMNFKNYSQMQSAAKQVVVLHHATEAVILTIGTPVFTYFMLKTNFILQNENIRSDIISSMSMSVGFLLMYLYEIASRFKTPRPMLLIHHILGIQQGFLFLIFPTTIIMKTGVIIIYFICFEALTFIGLFMYRMAPLNKLTPKIIFSGIVVFGITRPIQVLWVIAAVFGSWNDPNIVKWQGIMQIFLTGVLTVIQFWSLTINFAVWKRSVNIIKHNCTEVKGRSPSQNTATRLDTMDTSDNVHTTSMKPDASTVYNDVMNTLPPLMNNVESIESDECDLLEDISFDEGFAAFLQFLNSSHDHDSDDGGSHLGAIEFK